MQGRLCRFGSSGGGVGRGYLGVAIPNMVGLWRWWAIVKVSNYSAIK
jgi:hypothetical protein